MKSLEERRKENREKNKLKMEEMFKNIPLKIRLETLSDFSFMDLIHELGYRESKVWSPEEDEVRKKIWESAKKMTQDILETIKEWEEDGRP